MSDKKLLNETTIRRFMKLAAIEPLAEEFLPEADEEIVEEEELEAEEEVEDIAPEEVEDDVEVSQETEIEEVPEGESVSLDDLKKGLQALVDAVPGLELEVEGEEEVELDVETEEEFELPAEEGEGLEAEEEIEVEEPGARDYPMEEEYGGGKDEYKRREGHRSGEGLEGHYKDYEGKYGGGKDEESEEDPGEEDYTWRKGGKSKTHPGHNLEEDIANRLAERVFKRLTLSEQKKKTRTKSVNVDALAERIMKRMIKKAK